MDTILDWLESIIDKFKTFLYQVFPTSPFKQYITVLDNKLSGKYIAWFNWFVPVQDCLNVFLAFLTCLALYYCYSVIARWIKVIS